MRGKSRIYKFAEESNMIEGVTGEDKAWEHGDLISELLLTEMRTADVIKFNIWGKPRIGAGDNVIVGNHVPPPGGQGILYKLDDVVNDVWLGCNEYDTHHKFELLHPFTDGNGRTGRAMWLWSMCTHRDYDMGNLFLREWYYQSLRRGRAL